MYCLDTNIIIAVFRGDKELSKKIAGVEREDVSFTIVTYCELLKGAYIAQRREESLNLIKAFTASYRLLALTPESCELFAKDSGTLRTAGTQTQDIDLLTACIAKEHGRILVTRNKKHFENIPGLKVETW